MKRLSAILVCAGLALTLSGGVSAETAVTVTSVTAERSAVTLVWEDVGADSYEIVRSDRPDGSFVPVAVTTLSTYRDSGLRQNAVYFYKVRPCVRTADGISRGPDSETVGRCCVELVEAPATQNPCRQQGRRITVEGLMLHSVGCAQESAAAFAQAWNMPDCEVLVHAVIEPSGRVFRLADWETRCWHCGGSGNGALIGIEMTEPNELRYWDGTHFSWSGAAPQKVISNYNTAVALFANLCFEFHLDPRTDILSHREGAARGIASGHSDPEHLWEGLGLGLTMDSFRQDVEKKMQGRYTERTAPDAGVVTASELNVRAAPGFGGAVVGSLPQGSWVTVTERRTADGLRWGRCAFGWIALDYVELR